MIGKKRIFKTLLVFLALTTAFLAGCSLFTKPKEEQVATPTLNLPGGDYSIPHIVEISCATADATIRYTIDGTEPTETSNEYTEPIRVYVSTTIKAKGFKAGWTPSATASQTYAIYLPPVPENFVLVQSGTIYPAEGIYTDGLTVSDFYIDKYQITQAEYEAVMGNNPSSIHGVGPEYPVYRVDWFSAIEYCNRRSLMEGLPPCYSYLSYGSNPDNWPSAWNTDYENHVNVSCDWNANGYRLPLEAEWEYAARGGLETHGYTYSGSNNVGEVAWYNDNSGGRTHEVGSKLPNELGIYDMSGNVYEWCWDICKDSWRAARGGSWSNHADGCTVSIRAGNVATYNYYFIGFRVCKGFP